MSVSPPSTLRRAPAEESWTLREFSRTSVASAVVAAATAFSMAVWSSAQRDPSAAAEARFLTVIVAGVLLATLPVLTLCRRQGSKEAARWLSLVGLPIACLAAMILAPAGADRATIVGVILAAGIALTLSTLTTASPFDPGQFAKLPPGLARETALREAALFSLIAFAAQTLLRPDEWLSLIGQSELGLMAWARLGLQLFVMPVLFGACLALLSLSAGRSRALFLLVAMTLCVGKISLPTLAVAALLVTARWLGTYGWTEDGLKSLTVLALSGTAVLILLSQSLFLAVLALLAFLGILTAPSASRATPSEDDPKPSPRFWPAILLVMGGILAQLSRSLSADMVGSITSVLLLLSPLLLTELLLSRRRATGIDRWALLVSILLGILASRLLEVPDALLVPALVLAVGTAVKPQQSADTQRLPATSTGAGDLLTLLLLVFGLAASAYPWLRPLPASELLGLSRSLISSLSDNIVDRSTRSTLIRWPAVTLDSRTPATALSCPEAERRPSHLILDAALANGTDLLPGSVVARVRLEPSAQDSSGFELRVGEHVAEWAARRPDFGDRPAPEPWLAWTSASGDFFGQRYRSHVDLEASSEESFPAMSESADCSISIELDPYLPDDVILTLFHLSATTPAAVSSSDESGTPR